MTSAPAPAESRGLHRGGSIPSIGLQLANLGIEANVSTEGSYSASLSYSLTGHPRYVGQRFRQLPAFLWTVDGV